MQEIHSPASNPFIGEWEALINAEKIQFIFTETTALLKKSEKTSTYPYSVDGRKAIIYGETLELSSCGTSFVFEGITFSKHQPPAESPGTTG